MTEPNAAPGFNFDARRWTARERIVAGGSVVLLFSLFLPWFRLTDPYGPIPAIELSGVRSGILWAVFIVALAIVVLLVVRAGLGRVPFAPPPGDQQLLAGATWLNLLLVLLVFLAKPSFTFLFPTDTGLSLLPQGLSFGWTTGAYLALIAAIVAAAATAIPRLPALPRFHRPPKQPTEG
jgi:hypothetical protein